MFVAVPMVYFPRRYEDVQHLAQGGMGDVYRATDTALGRRVAVKVLAERYAANEDIRRRFRNEGLAAARLSGAPFTVTIFDVGEAEGRPFIVMELLEGGSLEDRLRTGPQPVGDVLRWLTQTAAALDAAHAAGVVHRDVKPGNLLLDEHGAVRVADFGVASAVGLDSLTLTGTVVGTAGYLSPEQARGERATPASDRYALAVVAWELLTGRRPFQTESATSEAVAHVSAPVPAISAAGELPQELDSIFQRALAKEPAARYASARDFVAALRTGLADAAGATRRIPGLQAQRPSRSRGLGLALALGLALLAIGGGFAVGALLHGDGAPQRTVVQTVTTQTVTPTPAPPPPPSPPPPPPPPPTTGENGVQLTDQATRLLGQRRWQEAEAVARRAVAALQGSGELYEAYAEYDLGRALAEQGKCDEAVEHLDRSERIQGRRRQIDEARSKCE
jgi:eukaryotic-like serine/threonine-protein kinase